MSSRYAAGRGQRTTSAGWFSVRCEPVLDCTRRLQPRG